MKLRYTCENCGRVEIYDDPEEAFQAGWDYPPRMGQFGVIGPRTCPNCAINTTLWWKLATGELSGIITSDDTRKINDRIEFSARQLSDHDKQTMLRILGEPESIMVEEDDHDGDS